MVSKRVSHGENLIQSDGEKTVKGSLILEIIFNLVPFSKRCEKIIVTYFSTSGLETVILHFFFEKIEGDFFKFLWPSQNI